MSHMTDMSHATSCTHAVHNIRQFKTHVSVSCVPYCGIVLSSYRITSSYRMCCLLACLQPGKPRYVMGIGYPLDVVVCSALGADMYDSVYPTRTARFGVALVPEVSNTVDRLGRVVITSSCVCASSGHHVCAS